jgi:hypothetical protein
MSVALLLAPLAMGDILLLPLLLLLPPLAMGDILLPLPIGNVAVTIANREVVSKF